jgi:hypothetical protein
MNGLSPMNACPGKRPRPLPAKGQRFPRTTISTQVLATSLSFIAALCLSLPLAAYGADPGVQCVISASPLNDSAGGYPYTMTMTCDHLASELHLLLWARPTNIPNYEGDVDDSPHCFGMGTACTAEGRVSCLRPGAYEVYAAGSGLFVDTEDPQLRWFHAFDNVLVGGLTVDGLAQLSIDFHAAPDQPGKVQAVVTYMLPQQYYLHGLQATEVIGGQSLFAGTLVPSSGQWTIPLALTPGAVLTVKPSQFCDNEYLAPPGTSANLRVTVPPPPDLLNILAQNVTTNAATETKPIRGSITASIPLGSRFTLALQKSTQPVAATFTLGSAQLENPQVDPSLYPHDALLEFDAATAAATKTFQAMHLGSQTIVIDPTSGTVPRQTVTVNVTRPASVGTTHGTVSYNGDSLNLDERIIDWADRRGIPPQLIKGIMDRESAPGFNPLEWRYEPLTTDWDNFAPPPRGQNWRAKTLYAPYRLEYDATHRRGWLLVDSEDVHPRAEFYADRTGATVHMACRPPFNCIDDAAQFVGTYTLYAQNDWWQNWHSNLWSPSKRALLATDALAQQTLTWPANTTLASSYGLMQVLFQEAFAQYGYPGIRGQRRPFYLFDTPANIRAGGGSLPTGSGLYVFKFRWENDYNDRNEFSPQFRMPADLDDEYENGLMGYNGSFRQRSDCYGPDTMQRIRSYPPVAPTSIFQ